LANGWLKKERKWKEEEKGKLQDDTVAKHYEKYRLFNDGEICKKLVGNTKIEKMDDNISMISGYIFLVSSSCGFRFCKPD